MLNLIDAGFDIFTELRRLENVEMLSGTSCVRRYYYFSRFLSFVLCDTRL